MKIRRLLALAVIVVLVGGISVAQGPKRDIGNKVPLPPVNNRSNATDDDKQQPPTALSIDVDLVNFDVVVTDNNGNPVGGMQKQQFKIFDDDVEQTITNFSPTEAPLTRKSTER